MGKRVLLAAPTGRAAQRMEELIGQESKTIHRLLGWQNGSFRKNEKNLLDCDFLIVDECSMLDITLTASLLRAVPAACQVVFIGDSDQLPSVGAGNVLKDIIASNSVACFRLTQIFRQARESLIIEYAHKINQGEIPWIESPFKRPETWQQRVDCLFVDADEATREQLTFINRVKRLVDSQEAQTDRKPNPFEFGVNDPGLHGTQITIPKKFQHVNLEHICGAKTEIEELKAVLKKVHPWSSLRYG
jgi:exodeoxyribonuclease V alpha subunit